ncbi:MAG: thiamine phosphate synthase [candidate division WOR-3 bacterium]|nr:thiamine phosphate synthase [candidate division WOR-3 bacterium]
MMKPEAKIKDQIIDANLNRLSEALRITEEIVRFGLQNQTMLIAIRQKKQKLWQLLSKVRLRVISARNSQKDLGRRVGFDKTRRANLLDVLIANIKRAQESSRLLEEIYKTENPANAIFFKQMRFWLYDLELTLLKQIPMPFDPRLYVIINTETVDRQRLGDITKQIIKAGATMIQLREPKSALTKQWLDDARKVKNNISNPKIKFIINDRGDVALAIDADGVHLGQDDMPLNYARRLLHFGKIIGVTTRNLQQAKIAERNGADYISVGAIYPSISKPSAPVVGIKTLKAVIKQVKIPVIAIGGIQPENIKELSKLGVCGIAISLRRHQNHQ